LTDDKRLQRKIDKHKETEARWLQKVLFATSKAKEAREKLAETTGEKLDTLITLDDGTRVPLDRLEEIIQKRVDDLMDTLGHSSYGRRK
jgi:uridine kinase